MSTNIKTTIKAPGRICLFGDHQDYLGLPIIACAINRFIEITSVVNTDKFFSIEMPDINSSRRFSIYEKFESLEKEDFFASAIRVVKKYGCIPDTGYTITIQGDIPINAGLSSSSALVVAWVHFLLETFGCNQPITKQLIAQISYEAEVVEHNSPGGKMDQYTSALGGVIFLETNDDSPFEHLKNTQLNLVVGASGEPKDTLGILGSLKEKAQLAIKIIKNEFPDFDLNNASLEAIDRYDYVLPQSLKPYFYAAINNHVITKKAYKALKETTIDLDKIGDLMNQHHQVLKNILKITTPKIDKMIAAALAAGAIGAKIVGSGGGGSICAMVPKKNQKLVIEAMLMAGAKNAFAVLVATGSHKITS